MGLRKCLRKPIVNQSDVALTLTKHVFSTKPKDGDGDGDGDLVFSPLSIYVVLGMIAAGSDGPTRHQLLRYLKAKSVQQLTSQASQLVTVLFADGAPLGGPRLSFANGVWVDKSLNLDPAYKQIVENNFRSALDLVDFKSKADDARQEVNTWAEKKTSGIIKELLPPDSVDSETRIILANAVYFKGTWNQKFDPSLTKNHVFFLLNGSSAEVPFMTSEKKQYISSFKDFKVLSLPYNQGGDKRRFAMHFFLPNAKDGLAALVERVSSESGFIEDHLPYKEVEVGDFRIPKFKINFGFEASEALRGHGLVLPFSCCHMANSTLRVRKIYQETSIEVNEEGTEAAAATAAVVQYYAGMRKVDPPIDFVADHPFLFVVREDMTGVVLFVGQVLNPELQGKGNGKKKRKRGETGKQQF
ncbi:hypothetical protein CASFOL_019476 [Castilleja foliolosa]|uniref:Serpin domain-containing protein n=1 Tax=Castilleja foliolosa TaxID=1961234 RepID=A0ABD3D651_9LAMI